MKIWYGYGSEHSMNLVMIGQFKDAGSAAKAKKIIDAITEQVSADVENGLIVLGDPPQRYGKRMLELLQRVNFHAIAPSELEQFGYGIDVELDANKIVLTTDESDVSAFLKILIDQGARVEVYSAHFYPREESRRGE